MLMRPEDVPDVCWHLYVFFSILDCAAARSCASVSSAVAVSDACSGLVYTLSMSPKYAVNLYHHCRMVASACTC